MNDLPFKLFRHGCGCLGGPPHGDGTAFVLLDCNGDLVFDRADVDDGDVFEARPTEVAEMLFTVRRAIEDARSLHALRLALHHIVRGL
jgi:hypothetical protein